jgi:acyl-[acyl-carrier-protein]-phospholipid O-acyltransferase/long-chain-fatty-acid--[acyl-carrier-protein] ligase
MHTTATDGAMASVLKSGPAMGEASSKATAPRASGKVRIASPRFFAFLTAQALGAANDNALKITLVLFLISAVSGETRQVRYSSLATALFPIPFLLFSPVAGYVADRFAKHRVLLWTKCPEILVMTMAAVGFALRSIPFLFVVLFLSAAHSAFFSPAKYGILPEVLEDASISSANGVLELTTDLAILIGSISGVYIYGIFHRDLAWAGSVFTAVACLGVIAIAFAPRAPAGNRSARFAWNVVSSFGSDLAEIRRSSTVFYTIAGIAWFGFLGSFFLIIIPVFGKNELGLTEERTGLLLALLSIGIGVGAVTAGRLSRKHVEIGLVPLGSLGITLFALALARSGSSPNLALLKIPADTARDLLLLGLAAGFFIIPLNALLQQRAPAGMKGRLIAFSNVLSFTAVLVAAAVPWALTSIGLSTRRVTLLVALLTLVGTIYVVRMLPDFLVRLVIWLATNTFYRIRTIGDENIPTAGALLVANHISWVDALLIAGSMGRMVRFMMYRPYYEWPGLNWFFRLMHVIPVAANDPPDKIADSLERAHQEIRSGHIVCIFAEGHISRTGNLLKFKRGLERIAKHANCPIIPVYLDGVWGSIFSFERGRFLFKLPKRLLEPITVYIGRAMTSSSTTVQVRQAIQQLSVEAFGNHKKTQWPIDIAFIRRAKRRWLGTLAVDAGGSRITFGTALVRAIALSRSLIGSAPDAAERIGIMMPPGIDAMLAHFAVWLAGRVPVDIDTFDPIATVRSIIASSHLSHIITTSAIVDSHEDVAPARPLRFDDLGKRIKTTHRWGLKLCCFLLPARLLARIFVHHDIRDVDRVATVLYSYPEDPMQAPRGAMLTHHNLLSNLESLRQVFHVTRRDCILGMAAFANSMSFTATLLLPALTGARVAYGAELLGTDRLGPFCRENGITLIPASPNLLTYLLNEVEADDLGALRYVAVGGAQLDQRVSERFSAKFGIEPLEGYGCPECAPIISLNIPDYGAGAQHQPGHRPGTAGHPLPGISIQITDPATGEEVAPGTEGILLVRGPNVMKGYLDGLSSSSTGLVGGWYRTGERASVDRDGFLRIARFTQ